MLKYYSIIIGENPEYTKTFQPASKRKVALYANCLIIPVILWFINSYLLVSHVLEGSFFAAILTAFVAGFIIFLIERAILMSNGSKPIFWFRIFLGFIVASLGSISLNEVIFKHDIDNQVAYYKQAEIDSAVHKVERDYQNQIAVQQSIVNQKGAEWNQSLKDAKSEADGTGGSHQRQVGKITVLKMNVAGKQEVDYNTENNKLTSLIASVDTAKAHAKEKAETDFNGNALLIRIRAMFDLIAKDKFMLGVYLLFTLFLFCLEFLVVLIKIGSKNSIDEDLEKAREQLLRAKTKKTLDRSEIFFQPEHFVPSVQNANAAIQQKPSSIFN
jgi:predicted membrane protein